MSGSFFLSLREGASFTQEGADQIVLRYGSWTSTFSRLSSGTLTAFQQLGSTGEYEDRLTDAVLATDGPEQLAKFYYYLHNLSQWSVLRRSVHLDGERLATLVPISLYFEYGSGNIAPDGRYLLSRFAYARAEGGETILESPLSHGRIIFHDRRAATLIHALAQPGRVEELASRIANISADAADRLLTLLLNAGMLTELTNVGKSVEDENPSLRSWEFHDLLFHSRSRIGRHDLPGGGTYRFVGQLDPPPQAKPACSDEVIALDRPDLERLKREDPPFALVQDARRSIREYDTKVITLQQLSEFLYRVGRVIRCDELEIQTTAGAIRWSSHAGPIRPAEPCMNWNCASRLAPARILRLGFITITRETICWNESPGRQRMLKACCRRRTSQPADQRNICRC